MTGSGSSAVDSWVPPLGRGALLGVVAAVPLIVYLRQFTVDDALIPARYAAHLARGLGFRFNAGGPATDGVTPLGFAHLLAPFAGGGPLAALAAARWLGALAWLVAAAALGARVAALSRHSARYAALLLLFSSAPLAGWAVAGLETGLVISLATLAAVLPSDGPGARWGAGLAGVAAWFRPEMIAWASVMALGRAKLASSRRERVVLAALSVLPWCTAAALRTVIFGRPAPLAVFAKPSDLAHGLIYVLPNLVFTGAPLAVLGFGAWRRLSTWPRFLIVAAFAHFAVVVLAGGDFMPLARLLTPVLPSLLVVVAHQLSSRPDRIFAAARVLLASAAEIVLLTLRGPAASHVLRDRLALVEAARIPLAGAERVATVDIGWVGAATEAEIIDLAGVTDPEIASLPGGHTSKAISGAFLTNRRPDRLVFQLAESEDEPLYARAVEERLAADPLIAPAFHEAWRSPADLPIHYVILER